MLYCGTPWCSVLHIRRLYKFIILCSELMHLPYFAPNEETDAPSVGNDAEDDENDNDDSDNDARRAKRHPS